MGTLKLQPAFWIILWMAAFSVRTMQAYVTVCPVNNQRFISRDDNLLPTTNIRATSEDALFNPIENFVAASTPPWCTAEGEGTVNGHFVELNFTEPIVVQLLQSQGFVNGYVNNFTIRYTMSAKSDDFETYGILEESQSFLTDSPLFDEGYFSLEQPIVARRIRFAINGGVLEQADRLCWEILLYGCTLEGAQTIQTSGATSATVSTPTASSSTDTLSATTKNADCLQTEVRSVASRDDILMIALPIALATIVTVLILVIVGVLVCVCVTRRRFDKEEPDYDTVTVRMLNNRTRQIMEGGSVTPNSTNFHYDSPRLLSYDVPRTARSRGGSLSVSSTDALHSPLSMEIRNPVYSIKRSPPENPLQLALMNMSDANSCGNDYEAIPEGVTSTENKLYGLQRSNSQPQSRPPNSNNTTTTPVSMGSSSDLSMVTPPQREKPPAAGENGSVGNVGNGKAKKQLTYDYATVNKAGLARNRTGSEPPRERSTTPIFETLYECSDQKTGAK